MLLNPLELKQPPPQSSTIQFLPPSKQAYLL